VSDPCPTKNAKTTTKNSTKRNIPRGGGATREEERRRGYFPVSRGLSASLVFVLPVLLIYEIGVYFLGFDPAAMASIVKSPWPG